MSSSVNFSTSFRGDFIFVFFGECAVVDVFYDFVDGVVLVGVV